MKLSAAIDIAFHWVRHRGEEGAGSWGLTFYRQYIMRKDDKILEYSNWLINSYRYLIN